MSRETATNEMLRAGTSERNKTPYWCPHAMPYEKGSESDICAAIVASLTRSSLVDGHRRRNRFVDSMHLIVCLIFWNWYCKRNAFFYFLFIQFVFDFASIYLAGVFFLSWFRFLSSVSLSLSHFVYCYTSAFMWYVCFAFLLLLILCVSDPFHSEVFCVIIPIEIYRRIYCLFKMNKMKSKNKKTDEKNYTHAHTGHSSIITIIGWQRKH